MKYKMVVLLILIMNCSFANAMTVDAQIRRGAAVFVCEQLRWAGLADKKIATKTYQFDIIRDGDQARLAIDGDIYELRSTPGISDFKMTRLIDNRWGVFEYEFTPDINQDAKIIRDTFAGKPTGYFVTSRRSCSGYLRDKSALKSRIQTAAIISLEKFLEENLDRNRLRVCSFNEVDSHLYIIVRERHKTRSYVIAIRSDIDPAGEKFIYGNDLVVQQLEDLESADVIRRC